MEKTLLPDNEAFRWHNLSSAGGTEYVYDADTGTEYEYADELGILAISQYVSNIVTFWRSTADEFDNLMIDAGRTLPSYKPGPEPTN